MRESRREQESESEIEGASEREPVAFREDESIASVLMPTNMTASHRPHWHRPGPGRRPSPDPVQFSIQNVD